MRELPRLPEGANADEKIRIIYDWLYELQMELKEIVSSVQNESTGGIINADASGDAKQLE